MTVHLSDETYDRFHDGYVALAVALRQARPYVVVTHSYSSENAKELLERIDLALAMESNLKKEDKVGGFGSHRIWVSEDRCILLTIWYDTPDDYITGKPANVTVATREDPSHTWGPPVTLTEETS